MRLRPWLVIAILLIGGMARPSCADVRHYVVEAQAVGHAREGDYYEVLLAMLLNASKAPDEVIDIKFSDRQYTQTRWIAELQRGMGNDVIWTMTTRERESILRPIRVPMFRGLFGKRVLVIRKEDAAKFAQINSREELAKLTAGQGEHWPDTRILQDNQLPVTTGKDKENLYKMLVAKRFDYFPRGLTEVASERAVMESNGLMVEPHIILSYPTAMYFFVSKKNIELAQRLEKGWQIILNNGEFDKFFFNHPRVKSALSQVKTHPHLIINLNNPELPAETPVDNPRYWLDINAIK